MSLSIVERQLVLEFVNRNRNELTQLIGPDAEKAHREDAFFEVGLVATLFESFVTSLGNLSRAIKGIDDLLKSAMVLMKWLKDQRDNGESTNPGPSLREKLLVILFEAYANNNRGLTEQRLRYYSDGSEADVAEALKEMKAQGIVRKTRQGSWKYVRQ